VSRLLRALRGFYKSPGWAVFGEVPSGTGEAKEDEHRRRADAVIVNLWPSRGHRVILVERKDRRDDYLREKRDLAKGLEIGRFCTETVLVVPAPWNRIVLTESELIRGWGLWEMDGSRLIEVKDPTPREAEPMTEGFMFSLLRAGAAEAAGRVSGMDEQAIVRPDASRTHVMLACLHAAPAPLAKRKDWPRTLPCFACAAGAPPEIEMVEAAVEDMEPEQLQRLHTKIAHLLGLGEAA
jgi:hypothetical protein